MDSRPLYFAVCVGTLYLCFQLLDGYKPWFFPTETDGTDQVGGWVSQYQNLVYNQVLVSQSIRQAFKVISYQLEA